VVVEDVKADLSAFARSLGFSHFGIAAARPLTEARDRLDHWLRKSYHAGMGWMERDPQRRSDPEQVLSGARSVISVAMNYYHPQQHSDADAMGRISRYAWGDDYHDVMDIPLRKLEEYLREKLPGSASRRYIDTGPVMDKAWAAEAGVGWLGKHGNIITRDRGSWVFLGEVLTTAELPADSPMADFCGTCTACLEACPTQAIVSPYVVDANRCLSYLTIEYRGEAFPEGETLDFDRWLYGCDTCQDVCPWNSNAAQSAVEEFAPRLGEIELPISEMAEMDDAMFRERFRRSPIKRTKAAGLRRNARTLLAQQESYTDR